MLHILQENFKKVRIFGFSKNPGCYRLHAPKKTPANHLEIPELEAPCKNIKSKEHKAIQLVDGDPSKTALIGANLDPK